MMMTSKCLIEKGDDRLMDAPNGFFGQVNDDLTVIDYSCDKSDGCAENAAYHQQIAQEWIELDKADTVEMHHSNNDETQKCSTFNSSKCVKKLFDEPMAQHQIENCGAIASTRSFLNDNLNGNISYSYRTHFYLNR